MFALLLAPLALADTYASNGASLTDRNAPDLHVNVGFGLDFPYNLGQVWAGAEYLRDNVAYVQVRGAYGWTTASRDFTFDPSVELIGGWPLHVASDTEPDFVTLDVDSQTDLAGDTTITTYTVQNVHVSRDRFVVPVGGVSWHDDVVRTDEGPVPFFQGIAGIRFYRRWNADASYAGVDQHLWGYGYFGLYAHVADGTPIDGRDPGKLFNNKAPVGASFDLQKMAKLGTTRAALDLSVGYVPKFGLTTRFGMTSWIGPK